MHNKLEVLLIALVVALACLIASDVAGAAPTLNPSVDIGTAARYTAQPEQTNTFAYPLQMTVQAALKGGQNIRYVITVTNTSPSLSFGPVVQLDPTLTIAGSDRHLIYAPNTNNTIKEWFVGKLTPGQSRQWVLSVAPTGNYSAVGWYTPYFAMYESYYKGIYTIASNGYSMK